MNRLFSFFYSHSEKYKNNSKYNIYTIFGIKITIKDKKYYVKTNNFYTVGQHTYGFNINHVLYHSATGKEKLVIGDYCSIAPDVWFVVASDHSYNAISTYPFKVKILGNKFEAISKGDIIVKDDVWIGLSSIILSGVTIGQGAIIGAGAVVTKDVPPYAIVGGNPAKVIKYRFEPEIIKKLLKFDYSRLSEEKIKQLGTKLYTEITKDNIDNLLEEFQG